MSTNSGALMIFPPGTTMGHPALVVSFKVHLLFGCDSTVGFRG